MSNNMATLQVKNLSKVYNNTSVLDEINFSVNDGEFVVLLGPSGSGKSTILRLIAGLDEPTIGEIFIGNKLVNKLHPKDRDIAMVFQNYALYPHLTVFENIAFPLKMKKYNNENISKLVNETAFLLGLKNHLHKKPGQLSGGEKQRVALGKAIIRKPVLFLMDEPLSNLDAKLRTQMRTELLKLHKTLGITTVYVTHDQIEAMTMGNKIVVLNDGKIQQIDTPVNVYNKPANTFVAGFIGSPAINFLDYKNDLILGIRPEHLKISQSGDLTFNAIVELIEILGAEYIIYAKSEDNKYSFTVKTTDTNNFHIGQSVTIAVDLLKSLLFDKNTRKLVNL